MEFFAIAPLLIPLGVGVIAGAVGLLAGLFVGPEEQTNVLPGGTVITGPVTKKGLGPIGILAIGAVVVGSVMLLRKRKR